MDLGRRWPLDLVFVALKEATALPYFYQNFRKRPIS